MIAFEVDLPQSAKAMRSIRDIFFRSDVDDFRRPKLQPLLWKAVADFAAEIQTSDFMQEMIRRRQTCQSTGGMGRMDCATLYGLVRWRRPLVIVESGGSFGMSSAFILKALADEALTAARLYSVESDKTCPQGVLIPDELRSSFVPLSGEIKTLAKTNRLPAQIDMFLHDSSHRLAHMLWEFGEFYERLSDGGLLVSHDVHFSAAFARFVAKTYAHNKQGLVDTERTTHYEWGRWGYVGFIIKKAPNSDSTGE